MTVPVPQLFFDRHCFMKALRSSPFLPVASALHVFIFSCCVGAAAAAGLLDRHSFMKALRSSPFFSVASLLHELILFCCVFAANAGLHRKGTELARAARICFIVFSICLGDVSQERSRKQPNPFSETAYADYYAVSGKPSGHRSMSHK